MRSVHRESSCSPPCGAGKRLSSVAKLATAPPSDARQRKAMGMSTHGHQQLSEHHAGHAGSHADAKVRYTMLAVLLVVSEPLTANALAPDHETWLFRSAIAARRNRQRVDEASSDHCGREVVSMMPVPITAAVKWSLVMTYAVDPTTLYTQVTAPASRSSLHDHMPAPGRRVACAAHASCPVPDR